MKKSRVRASPVIVFIELLLTMINFMDGRERVNSKDNFDANPSVKAAEFSEVSHWLNKNWIINIKASTTI